MAIRAVNIEKEIAYRGARQRFSNTYHYYNEIGDGAGYEAMIDAVVAMERQLHSGSVTFMTGRLWSAGGTALQNETLLIKDLAGTGTGAADPAMDRERAILMQWDCGRNIKGKKVYLRKWYHTCGGPLSAPAFTTAILNQTAPLDAAHRDAFVALVNDINTVGGIGGVLWEFCSPRGVTYKSEPVAYPWLEHHQLGDNWRG